MRLFLCAFACAALAACGGLLSDDENVTTTTFGTPVPPDGGGAVSVPATPDVDVGNTDIAALPGLVLWLQSTRGLVFDESNGPLNTWLDLSPRQNRATRDVGSGIRVGEPLNGYDTLAFDGHSSLGLSSDALLDDWNGDYLVEVVVRPRDHVDLDQTLLSCRAVLNSDGPTDGVWFWLSGDKDDGGLASGGVNEGNTGDLQMTPLVPEAASYGWHFQGSTMQARRNGMVVESDDVPSLKPQCVRSLLGGLDGIGNGSATDSFFASEIAEVIVVHGTIDDAAVELIEHDLVAKYGLH